MRSATHHLTLNVLEDVKDRLYVLTPGDGAWTREPLAGAPPFSTVSAMGLDPEESDEYFMNVTGYLTPSSLLYGRVGQIPARSSRSCPPSSTLRAWR